MWCHISIANAESCTLMWQTSGSLTLMGWGKEVSSGTETGTKGEQLSKGTYLMSLQDLRLLGSCK